MGQFQGFGAQGFDLLFEIRQRDSRAFYEEVKPMYQKLLLEPMKDLVSDIAPLMLEADERMQVTPAIGKTISRLRRDTRFTHDKSLYRDSMWFFFRRTGLGWLDAPGFAFEISSVSYRYGCGMYHAGAPLMNAMREKIDADVPAFCEMAQVLRDSGRFEILGDKFKRTRAAHLPEVAADWYDRRDLYICRGSGNLEEICSPGFAQTLYEDFRLMIPAYRFLMGVYDDYTHKAGLI